MTARSGLVDYADQVIVHQTRDSRILLRPIFIPHATKEQGLTVKLIRQPLRWAGVRQPPDQEINLDEAASSALLAEMSRLAQLAGHPPGNYLFVPIQGEFRTQVAPELVARSLVRVLGDPQIAQRFAGADFGQELVEALRSN